MKANKDELIETIGAIIFILITLAILATLFKQANDETQRTLEPQEITWTYSTTTEYTPIEQIILEDYHDISIEPNI